MKQTKLFLALLLASTIGQAQAFTVGTNLETKHYRPTNGSKTNVINTGYETIQFINTSTNTPMDIYTNNGEYFLAGKNGQSYSIKICPPTYRNQSWPMINQRLLNIISVDGLNVVSGQPASTEQTGYVVDQNNGCTIVKGWRKNMNEEAEFILTDSQSSYSAKRDLGTANVGVIGVAIFREKIPEKIHQEILAAQSTMGGAKEAAPMAANNDMVSSRMKSMDSQVLPEAESKLGTGHGGRVTSQAKKTDFERESSRPNRVIKVFYDSYRNLVNKGVITEMENNPNPFPEDKMFAPDPRR